MKSKNHSKFIKDKPLAKLIKVKKEGEKTQLNTKNGKGVKTANVTHKHNFQI